MLRTGGSSTRCDARSDNARTETVVPLCWQWVAGGLAAFGAALLVAGIAIGVISGAHGLDMGGLAGAAIGIGAAAMAGGVIWLATWTWEYGICERWECSQIKPIHAIRKAERAYRDHLMEER